MNTIPFVSSDKALVDRVIPLVDACKGCEGGVVPISGTTAEALELLLVELPDLIFINFSDPAVDSFGLLDSILKESWLLHSNIVAFCDDHDVSERVEKVRGANIVISLIEDGVERYLPRILDIIVKNKRILFQRTIAADLVQTITGSFKLNNDILEANCYANLLCNFLYNANKIDLDGKMGVNLALTEMLINAIEHGNCGITYKEKGEWLEEGNMMSSLIEKRCQDPEVRHRRVMFDYTIKAAKSTFHIADEGEGFDWRNLTDAARSENVMELHGRGIKLTRKYTKKLSYNDKGNEVSFEIEHVSDCTNTVPALLENLEPTVVKTGDIVFKEGEASNFLYYIATGRYDVIANDTVIATMSANDIFMGEMSFLLNNRRSATVRAKTDGKLIRVSKKDFVELIKNKPHYLLLLSRLLAKRVLRHQTHEYDESVLQIFAPAI